jgi:hypothetical protein
MKYNMPQTTGLAARNVKLKSQRKGLLAKPQIGQFIILIPDKRPFVAEKKDFPESSNAYKFSCLKQDASLT